MRKLLLNQSNLTRRLRLLSMLFAMFLSIGAWGQEDYAIRVAGVDVTSENADAITGEGIQGTVTYNADQGALILDGATITGNIVATGGFALTIKVKGENVINAGESSAIQAITEPNIIDLAFVKEGTGDCSLQLNSTGITVISTYFNPTYTNLALVTDVDANYDYQFNGLSYYDFQSQSVLPVTSATITSYTTYDIIVSGEQVTSLNMNSICEGTVGEGHITFDGNHTLTFNEVPGMVFNGQYPFIQTSMDLTINLVGNSYFDCGQSVFITRMPGDNDTHTVTFTTDATKPGMLTLQAGNQFNGFDMAFENGLEWMPEGYYDTSDPEVNNPVAWVAQPFALDGEGTEESPYLIKTADDLKSFSNYVNNGIITTQYVKLENDIDCSKMTGFVPIGSDDPFIGTFYGNNKTISGLTYISESADDIVGLFARVGTEGGPAGTIQDLVLEDCSLSGGYINGGIVGFMNSGTLQNCKVTGNSTIFAVGANSVAGAIIGSYSQGALIGNYYYYTVTTSTKESDGEEPVVKSGHEERGIGDSDDITADDGAMLYTQQLTITGLGEDCAYEGDSGYDPLADYDSFIFHYAPSANVTLYLYPNENLVPSVTLSYIETGETEPTIVPLEKDPDEDGYVYSFTMPDVDATFAITLSKSYPLYIGDTQVTDANADDVLGDGKVSFTESGGQEAAPTYTLTLNGAAITEPVKVGLPNLTFDIRGTNTITTDETCIQNTAETFVPSLTFKSNADVVGSLTLTDTDEDGYNGVISSSYFDHFTIGNELALIMLRYGNYTSNTYYFTAGEVHNAQLVPSYGVQVGDMQIYEGNAADVFGDGTVSFDKETNILTLNGANTGALCTSLAELTVELVGDNTLTEEGSYPVLRSLSGDDVAIKIQSTADVKGTLTMHMPYTQAGNFCEDQVTLNISAPLSVIAGSLTGNHGNDNTVVIGVNYGITINTDVASVVITSQNRKNVLGDQAAAPTVQFDGRNTLILNGANIGGITIGAMTSMDTTDGLIVHLKGNNTITNGTKAIANEGNAMPLTLTTSDVDQGKLVYICTTCTLEVANSAFSGFTPIKYKNNLFATLETEDAQQIVTIVACMEPFVTYSGEENTEDGGGDGLGEDIEGASTPELAEGVLVHKLLYTLPDVDDGYMLEDGKKLVALNSWMTDDEVNAILEDIKNGTIQPGVKIGNPTFAERFHGMTFLLPAGNGEIILEVNTNKNGELHVKVGSSEPYVITSTTDPDTGEIGFEEKKIPYALTEESYVFIYSAVPYVSASRADDHRAPGRKETTTTEIRGLSVSASSVDSTPDPALSPKTLGQEDIVVESGHIKVVDADVTSLDDDVFDGIGELEELTYVDLSETGITGLTVDRNNAPFSTLLESTFIYMPVGNEVAADTKNVIVGSVCEQMLLGDGAEPFEVSYDFKAVEAEQERDYSELLHKNCTIYLPFALNQETAAELGELYKMLMANDGKVWMSPVDKTEANTPYMFKPNVAKVSVEMVDVKKTIPTPTTRNGVTFLGTYQSIDILSDSDFDYYCFVGEGPYAGKFVKVVDNAVTVNPFRAYMMKPASSTSLSQVLDIDWGDGTTAIKNIKVGTEDNVYYDLQGRRVLYPKKGIYIVNGHKVVIK